MNSVSRSIWLRRCDPSNPNPSGGWHDLALPVIGNAAARETLITATPHMAAIWTDLFRSLIVPGSQLRWRGDGPGIGRDARIAYSSLLGRYLARAYLTEYEGVRVLVPLDVAKRRFEGTPYVIEKDPPIRVYEADWIGLDDAHRLVIVEAKGTFDEGVRTWRGPYSRPPILKTAINQAEKTAVFMRYPRRKLPAKRWAIASRWGTEENGREPTLLAWDPEEEKLDKEDYRKLAKILLGTDLYGVLEGLGHRNLLPQDDGRGVPEFPEDFLGDGAASERIPEYLRIRVGGQDLDPGFAAIVGSFGIRPLRGKNDLIQVTQVRDLNIDIAVASLSRRYIRSVVNQDPLQIGKIQTTDEQDQVGLHDRFANRAGLTVVWPEVGENVTLVE